MAITIERQPSLWQPAFNPIVLIANSTNRAQLGFRYIVTVVNEDTLEEVTLRIPPRFGDGKCIVDISTILQGWLKNKLDVSHLINDNYYINNNWMVRYSVIFGEEYVVNWRFTGTIYASGGKTIAVGSNHSNVFSVGDMVNIIPDDATIFPAFSGLQSIELVPTSSRLRFDIPFQSTPTNSGAIRFADNRRTINENVAEVTRLHASKSSVQAFSGDGYNLSFYTKHFSNPISGGEFLTTYSGEKYTHGMDLIIPHFAHTGDRLILTSSTSSAFSFSFSSSFNEVVFFIDVLRMYHSEFNDSPEWIDVVLRRNNRNTYLRLDLSRENCAPNSNILVFEDSLGGFQSFIFEGFAHDDLSVNKSVLNKNLPYNFSPHDDSKEVYNIDYSREKTLHSYPLTVSENAKFNELIMSPQVYWKLDADTYIPVTILTDSSHTEDEQKLGLKRRSVKISFNNNSKLNV